MRSAFYIRQKKKWVRLNLDEIMYVEAVRNFSRIVTADKRKYMVLANMKVLDKQLPSVLFCRVHRSFIVGYLHITAFDSEKLYVQEKEIPIGQNYKRKFMKSIWILHQEISKLVR